MAHRTDRFQPLDTVRRLVAEDEGTMIDETPQLVAYEVPDDGLFSAEEAAVHLVPLAEEEEMFQRELRRLVDIPAAFPEEEWSREAA